MAKADLIEEAVGLGIELTREDDGDVKETIPELEKLIDEKRAETPGESKNEEAPEEGEDDGESVDVLIARPGSSRRTYVRTYSLEQHGDDYKDLAKQFITKPMYSKRGYILVPSGEVLEVEVRYREKQDFELPLDEQKPDSPIVDKVRRFKDKQSALAFNNLKKGSIIARTG